MTDRGRTWLVACAIAIAVGCARQEAAPAGLYTPVVAAEARVLRAAIADELAKAATGTPQYAPAKERASNSLRTMKGAARTDADVMLVLLLGRVLAKEPIDAASWERCRAEIDAWLAATTAAPKPGPCASEELATAASTAVPKK
jgi:hypothetical protein